MARQTFAILGIALTLEQVVGSERMAAIAVCSQGTVTPRSTDILSFGHDLQVRRIGTRWRAAQMVKRHPFWDRADECLEHHSMDVLGRPLAVRLDRNLTVSTAVMRPTPQPTISGQV